MKRLVISCEQGIFDGTIELSVHDREDVTLIMDSLKDIEGIEEIKQIQ
jgi:GTP pyrophosphokinase